jgi:hypothetical protein
MKRILCTVAVLMVATSAFAGDMAKIDQMTPEQAWASMTNCPVCSVWMTEPALGPTLRHSVFATKNGYVETLVTADASMMPAFNKCAAECEKRAAGMASMPKDQKDKLCPMCVGQAKFMDRKDVTVEHFKTDTGIIWVASGSAPDGTKALHDYAAASKAFGDKMAQAGEKMSKEPMKSKM